MSRSLDHNQLRNLTPVERIGVKLTHGLNTTPWLRRLLTRLNSSFGMWWVEAITSKSVQAHFFEHFAKIDPNRGVLLVANHRTFYDQFAIAGRLFKLYGAHHNIYFPVRANFFYDSPVGLLVNLLITTGVMYPPIVRDANRRDWNRYALELMAQLLAERDNFVGFHPEGTRNRGPDPYRLLPAKPGCGEIVHRSNPNVVPVFVNGFPGSVRELWRNNRDRSAPPFAHMVMGEPIDFSAERELPADKKTYLLISQKAMSRIADLAAIERDIRAGRSEAVAA